MIPLFPTQLLAQNTPYMNGDGTPVTAFYFLVKALFDRTGQNNGIPFTVGAGLVPAGTSQADALPLVDDFNEVIAGGGGVVLDALRPGQLQLVYNGSGANLNIYPALAGVIDALTPNVPYSLPNTKTQIFWCSSLMSGSGGPQYRSVQLG